MRLLCFDVARKIYIVNGLLLFLAFERLLDLSALPTQAGGVPVLVLKEGANRSRGREAQHNNITAAKVVAESIKSAFGPKGMDKLLVDNFGDIGNLDFRSGKYLAYPHHFRQFNPLHQLGNYTAHLIHTPLHTIIQFLWKISINICKIKRNFYCFFY